MINLSIGSQQPLALAIGSQKVWEWSPELLFPDGEQGLFLDPSILSSLSQDSTGATPVTGPGQSVGRALDRSGRGNHARQATAATKPTLGRHPRGGVRNLAHGVAAWDDTSVWPSTVTYNGVTMTVLGGGVEAGEYYIDVHFLGTPTGNHPVSVHLQGRSRGPATVGQAWTSSARVRRIAGSVSGVLGIGIYAVEELSSGGQVGASRSAVHNGDNEVMLSATRTIVSGDQRRMGLGCDFTTGTPIDVTFRLRGIQFEQAAARGTYQVNLGQYDITEAGQPNAWYMYHDPAGDWLDTQYFDWGSGEATLVVVAAAGSGATPGAPFRFGSSSSAGGFWHDMPAAVTTTSRVYSGGGSNQFITDSISSPQTLAVRSSRSRLQPASLDYRVNGALIGTNTNTQGANVSYPTPYYARIGSWFGNNHFAGNIYGLFAINRLLTDVELSRVERYFAERTGVTLA